jgi:mRNA interferase RelE/StbE
LTWSIEYTDTALRTLRKMDRQVARRLLDFMDERIAAADNPRALGKPLRGSALGDFWRCQVGDWRLICDLQDSRLVVLVIDAGHRRDIYE